MIWTIYNSKYGFLLGDTSIVENPKRSNQIKPHKYLVLVLFCEQRSQSNKGEKTVSLVLSWENIFSTYSWHLIITQQLFLTQ